jgi:hypothetical protein
MSDEHANEFNHIEWYWAYADYQDQMKLTREVMIEAAKAVYGKTNFTSRGHSFDLAGEWKQIDYASAIKEKFNVDIFTTSDADIKKMHEDAEKYKAEDEKKKELVDKRNTADTTVFAAEKSLKEYGDKIPAETKTAIEDKVKALKETKDKDDADAIHKATEELSTEMMKIYEVIQKAEQEKQAAAQGAQSEPAAEPATDGEAKAE